MLRQADFTKKFEALIQQEIINNNKTLNEVYRLLNCLQDQIKAVEQQSIENYALLASQQKKSEIELELLKDAYAQTTQKFNSHLNDQRAFNENTEKEIEELSDALIAKIPDNSKIQGDFERLWNELHSMRKEAERTKRIFDDNLDDLLRRIRKEIGQCKEEILSKPTEAKSFRDYLEVKIASHAVDVAGIMRELNIYKRDNYITQKKIENLYTLIDRLKGEKGEPSFNH